MKGRPVRAATINDAPAPTTLHIALVNVEELNRNIHSILTQLPKSVKAVFYVFTSV